MSAVIAVNGNLVNEPSLRKLNGEKYVCSFTLATSRKQKIDDNTWVDKDKLYLEVECWGSLAQNVRTSLAKGMPAVCMGSLYTDSFQSKDGQMVTKVKLRANTVGMDLSRHVVFVAKMAQDGSISLGGMKMPTSVTGPDADFSATGGLAGPTEVSATNLGGFGANAPGSGLSGVGAPGDDSGAGSSDADGDADADSGNSLAEDADSTAESSNTFNADTLAKRPLVGAGAASSAGSIRSFRSDGDAANSSDADEPPF